MAEKTIEEYIPSHISEHRMDEVNKIVRKILKREKLEDFSRLLDPN